MKNNIMKLAAVNVETMSSTQLLELIPFKSKSELNRAIRNMFQAKIDDATIASSLDSRGYVNEYHLPELESKMFVAKHDINYLEKITQYWIDRKNHVTNVPTWLSNLSPIAITVIEDLSNQLNHERQEKERITGVCNELVTQFVSGMSIRDFCRQLNGLNINKVKDSLFNMNVLYKENGKDRVCSKYRNTHFREVITKFTDSKGIEHTKIKIEVLDRGTVAIYKAYIKDRFVMKKNWDRKYSSMPVTVEAA